MDKRKEQNRGLAEALRRLEQYKPDKQDTSPERALDLNRLDLTTDEFRQLIPVLRKRRILSVSMGYNQLTTLPEELGTLSELVQLDLIDNQISLVPEHLSGLSNLRITRLDGNPLGRFPEFLLNVRGLRTLWMNGCGIKDIPRQISKLSELRELLLRGNRISELPAELGRLPHLAELHLSENLLPEELGKLSHDELLQYLRELAKAKPTLFNEAKLLLVGPGEVGKTFLLQAIQGRVPKAMGSTKGVEITRQPLDLPHPENDGRMIHFNCWDFGGQEYYQITHQIFFSPKAIYLLVWKPRPGFDPGLENRLERIQLSAGKTAKVYIVSTHADDNVPAVIGEDALRERFGDLIAGFHAVDSAKGPAGRGIEALKQAIAKAAAKLEGMETEYPATWVDAQRAIRAMDEPAIPFSHFTSICVANGVAEPALSAKALASIMDVQGHVTYFDEPEDSATRGDDNYVILRPEWLAKAVTFVLEDEPTRAGKNPGVLAHRRLSEIWSADLRRDCPGYGPELHRYFLWLMWTFDIAYQQDDHTSLVPELIQRNRPDGLPWTPMDRNFNDRQVTIICRISDGQPPVGLVPVMTAAVHPLRRIRDPFFDGDQLDRNWNQGFFLDTERRGTAFAELVDREFRFTVRHPYPADLAQQLRQILTRRIEERWPNLRHDFVVSCSSRVGSKPCRGRFIYSWLKTREGMPVQCQECGNDTIKADDLLDGFDASGEEARQLLRELKDGQSQILAVAMKLYRDMLDPEQHEVRRAPCMLTVVPEESNWLELMKRATQANVRIHCWCEHPDGPHRDVPLGSRQTVEAVIRGNKTWVADIAPYVAWTAGLLKAVIPVVGSVVKHASDGVFPKDAREDVALMSDIAKALPNVDFRRPKPPKSGAVDLVRPEIEALRRLHDVMEEQWSKDKRWGGLRPVLTKTGQILWLCEQHAAIQTPPVLETLN